MASKSTNQFYPEHDRTSCSDAYPVNACAEGSTGCARCTSLALERGTKAIALLRRLIAAWEYMERHPDTPSGRATLDSVVNEAEALTSEQHSKGEGVRP